MATMRRYLGCVPLLFSTHLLCSTPPLPLISYLEACGGKEGSFKPPCQYSSVHFC
uniref:Uncharacterized protein n=1 Tax=Anguilla anguilla TaxID=7936 RepID=A0A0E9UV44_ANGAN